MAKLFVYCDESVDVAVAAALRRRGVDASTAAEEGKLGWTDEEQLRFAARKKAAILTHDVDFLRIVRREAPRHWGILYADQRRLSIGDIVRRIVAMASTGTAEDVRGRIVFL